MNASVAYEIFVPSFCDSNGDGIGDLQGMRSKLPYLKDLGVDLIWLSPIFASPSYHKYDVRDYYAIDAGLGSMSDFEQLIVDAHAQGIRLILDLVINHSSERHPWFLDAKHNVFSQFRDYYIWKTPKEIKDLNAEQRAETADSQERNPWHLAHKTDEHKYYGMFWSGMPDLNLANDTVQKEVFSIAQYWLKKGVDGFRIDAAKHVFPPWQEDMTQPFWQKFANACKEINAAVYIVGEVWTSADKVAPYYQSFNSNFNFELGEQLRHIVRNENGGKELVAGLNATYGQFKAYNRNFIDATILGNHDMERIGTVANAHVEKLKMAAFIQFTLPGLPYVYYGDELGMLGPKPDERIREAFLWDTRWEDKGRCQWQKPKFNTDSKVSPMAIQEQNEDSLFCFYKKIIKLRKSNLVLSDVENYSLEIAPYAMDNLVCFYRKSQNSSVLVFQNISHTSFRIQINENINRVLWLEKVEIADKELLIEAYGSAVLEV